MTNDLRALAEHPPDDEPVTFEGLKVMLADTELTPWLRHGKTLLTFDSLIEVKTRGDVRRLCKVLGVELKETKGGE